jgi:hypothetical protein
MFWIFTAFAGLMALAVTLGQITVWFALLKIALMVAVGVIAVLAISLLVRRSKEGASK